MYFKPKKELLRPNFGHVIVLYRDGEVECWGNLKELCMAHGYSWYYVRSLKFPFVYKGVLFAKVPYRALNGV